MDPLQEYESRREHWRESRASLQRTFVTLGNVRLAIACFAAVLAWLAFVRGVISPWWLFLPLAFFVALLVWHQRIIRLRTFADRAISFYDQGLRRIKDEWIGRGNQGTSFIDENHVYAEDLDIFGKGSLFELIATARTAAGERTLADWLLSPATHEQALLRQASARELSTRLKLREDLALLGEDIRAEVNADSLARWGSAEPIPFPKAARILAPILAVAGIVSLLAVISGLLPLWPLLLILVCDFALIFLLRDRVSRVFASSETAAHDLRIISLMIERLEREQFESPGLQQLKAAFASGSLPGSRRIAQLQRRIEWLESSDHLLIRATRPLTLWNQQVAMAVEAWRSHSGPLIAGWIRALAEFEALSSFATLTFEHPEWTFPSLVTSPEPCFEAEALQHPLIPSARCVPNDISLNPDLRLLIVSGSNMSGKSTLLRAVGLNTALAWAGAPVSARRLRVSRLHVGASIRVTDSLQDNRSRFFAEIQRIRQIVDLTKSGNSVLFLLDELLSGTNSHDRQIGAEAIVRGLLKSNAIGLITTHDLALTGIANDLGSIAANVHFEDRIVNGSIQFDYRLRAGIVTHSNALELMRAVGLEV